MGLCGGSSMTTISLVLCYKIIPQTHSHFGEAAIKGFSLSLFWNLSMLVRRIKGRLAPCRPPVTRIKEGWPTYDLQAGQRVPG